MTRDEKLQMYLKEARKYFPAVRANSVFSIFTGDHPTSGKIEMKDDDTTIYFPLHFIHYTSMASFKNIMASGTIWLYNLTNMNDPSELSYFLNETEPGISATDIAKYKSIYFVLSGSEWIDEDSEDFNLWRFYGDNGKGVAIVFEISEKVKLWPQFAVQKVSYGRTSTIHANASAFASFHTEFQKEHQLFENTPDFFVELATGFKNEIWSVENEIRLVVRNDFDYFTLQTCDKKVNHMISRTLAHELNENGILSSFVSLPLHTVGARAEEVLVQANPEVKRNTIDYVPNLKVKKIIFGPRNSPPTNSYRYFQWLAQRFSYDFEVCRSNIAL